MAMTLAEEIEQRRQKRLATKEERKVFKRIKRVVYEAIGHRFSYNEMQAKNRRMKFYPISSDSIASALYDIRRGLKKEGLSKYVISVRQRCCGSPNGMYWAIVIRLPLRLKIEGCHKEKEVS